MILLAAALGIDGPCAAVRGMPTSFDDFMRQVVCVAVRASKTPPARMVVLDTPACMERFGTLGMAELREQALLRTSALSDEATTPAECRRREAALLGGMLRITPDECTYHPAPSAVPDARPVVLISDGALSRYGRLRMLRALWKSELAAGAGEDYETGALYDETLAARRAFDRKTQAARS